MEIEEKVRKRFSELINAGQRVTSVTRISGVDRDELRQKSVGWLASAQNLIHFVVNNPANPYRASTDRICAMERGYGVIDSVGEVNMILIKLLEDIDTGLLASIENQARAMVFDDFLDHAKEYAKGGSKNEAGVIAGVVFEDTLRTICRNKGIEEKDIQLDTLINALAKAGTLTSVQAKRAKAAAYVRTKATHAQWDEFEMDDLKATIEFTEELIRKNLDE
ncbi:MAG: hypothetical protein PHR28_09895 [candidate division Zixibacteria bacterium]|nr:hypothetical protein [candidate division Zixibacteria bacterium]